MKVPLLDLRAQYAPMRARIEQAIREVCDSQQFVLGPRVAQLERDVARYSGAAHAIGMSSGTDALLAALMALDIGSGDEVITSPYTFFATAGVIARVGARPVFSDIDASTFNLAAAKVREFIEKNCETSGSRLVNRNTGGTVRALMPVHLYGQMADMDLLLEIARSYRLPVIEDAAQAIGANLPDGRRAGSLGSIGCFSFFPTKNLGAFGDGGMCTANDAELAQKLRTLRVHGSEPKYYHALIGGNFRLDELQAAVLSVKLECLEDWTAARQRNAAHYTRAFAAASIGEFVSTPAVKPGYRHIFNQYVIRAARRDDLRAYLLEHGIGTEIYYPVPLHSQQCFSYLGHRPEDFPESLRASQETLALPVYPELEPEQLDYVVQRTAAFYGR
jgi:dTDP-4-amino-4,6-dideoxygalactose transaminase